MKIFTNNSDDIMQNRKTRTILIYLLLISIIIIPFDDLPYLPILSGIGRRAALYPFFLIIPIITFLSLKNFKIYLNVSIEKIFLMAFYIWILISVTINLPTILNSIFKGSSGIGKMIIHLITLTFILLSFYCMEIIISNKKITLHTIRFFIMLSLIPVTIVSLMEIINTVKVYDLSSIIENISYTFNTQLRGFVYGGRSRSISAEASYLGMYCAFIFPWILSYLYTEKKAAKKFLYIIISLIVLLIVVATKSRTATILLLLELFMLIFLIVIFYRKKLAKLYTVVLVILFSVSLFIYPKALAAIKDYNTVIENTTTPNTPDPNKQPNKEYEVGSIVSSVADSENLSNIGRSTMQQAAVGITKNNPIFGVGIGQFGFNFSPYINKDSLKSQEVKIWLDNNIGTWPPVHSLYHKIASESGLIGLILFLGFIITICLKLFIKIIKSGFDLWGIFLLISYSSTIIGLLTIDTFLITQFWLMSAIVILYTNNKLKICN